MLDSGIPRQSYDGGFAGYIGSCIDITERKRTEQQNRFLTDASATLSELVDFESTLQAWAGGVAIAAFELASLYEHGVKAGDASPGYLLAPDAARAWSWYEKGAAAGAGTHR